MTGREIAEAEKAWAEAADHEMVLERAWNAAILAWLHNPRMAREMIDAAKHASAMAQIREAKAHNALRALVQAELKQRVPEKWEPLPNDLPWNHLDIAALELARAAEFLPDGLPHSDGMRWRIPQTPFRIPRGFFDYRRQRGLPVPETTRVTTRNYWIRPNDPVLDAMIEDARGHLRAVDPPGLGRAALEFVRAVLGRPRHV